MKRSITLTIIAVVLFGSLLSCSEEKFPDTHGNHTGGEPDAYTMATANGGELKPAMEGPVRAALGIPTIDLTTFTLTVTGMVDSSYSLSWEEIQGMESVTTDTMIMYCVEGWEVWGVWKGVLIRDLLEQARVQEGGDYILFDCRDGYQTALPVSYLLKYNTLLAYQVNNAPLQTQYGFPLRLIAFGKYGYKWAKWIYKLTVIDKSQPGYWEKLGFSDQANVSLDRRRFYEGDTVRPLEY